MRTTVHGVDADDLDIEAGFLPRLAHDGFRWVLVRVERAAGKHPDVALGAAEHEQPPVLVPRPSSSKIRATADGTSSKREPTSARRSRRYPEIATSGRYLNGARPESPAINGSPGTGGIHKDTEIGCMMMCMRTNIEIDDEIMREAQQLAGTKTKRETVDLALRELVARRRSLGMVALRGRFEWEGDLSEMRRDREFG